MMCQHSGTWIMAGGFIEWCYICGAIRNLERVERNASIPKTTWVRPTGDKADNPYNKMRGLR